MEAVTSEAIVLLLLLALVVISLYWSTQSGSHGKPPPSPLQLPLIGCLPFVNTKLPHLTFSKWAEAYGQVYSIRMGRQLAVVLNDVGIIREAFSRTSFNGRPEMYTTARTSQGYGELVQY